MNRILKRRIPRGEHIPAVGLGTWQAFDRPPDAALKQVLSLFHQTGGRLIDSSPMYGKSESTLGALISPEQADYFLATKVWTRGENEGLAQIEESFRRLRVQKLDLLQIHNLLDWRLHLKTLRGLKDQGRIRYIGVTHYSASAFDEMLLAMQDRAVDFVQIPYSVLTRAAEESIFPKALDRGIAVIVNRPFEEGALLRRLKTRPLPVVASELGCYSWAELLLKFILAREEVTCVIPATANPDHMREILRAGSGRLPDAGERDLILRACM